MVETEERFTAYRRLMMDWDTETRTRTRTRTNKTRTRVGLEGGCGVASSSSKKDGYDRRAAAPRRGAVQEEGERKVWSRGLL